ncbi:hypothetical protein INT47_003757 [Mucor saturninus]|uniref:Vacuolar ATPase assembly integral membrane protein VMA21 n=1 Tax=Mucor saturninus TaxID=64648 RepID=A0A8H7V7C8_9FUNG|nr:hypothetical protein INT47_003757 [Mucor saturninus]
MSNSENKVETTDATPLHVFIGQNAGVITKLLGFSAALFAFPIVTFFLTLHSLFDGNTTYAAGAAAVMANVVVILYIITAIYEKPKKETVEKKEQ